MKRKKSNIDKKHEIKQIQKQIENYCKDPAHRKPQTRREFLNTGLLSVGTSILAPSIFNLLGQSAWAKELPSGYCGYSNGNMPAFINLQLAGGPALFAQHLPCEKKGARLSRYLRLGMNSDGPKEELLFKNNAPFWKKDGAVRGSGFIEGLRDRLGNSFDDITKKTHFVAVACKSIDDTYANKHDLSGMLSAAGLGLGNSLPYLLCETDVKNITANVGDGKIRFKDAILPVPAYLSAKDPDAIKAALGFKGQINNLSTDLNTRKKIQQNLISLIDDLSTHQARELFNDPNSSESKRTFLKLASCAAENNSKIFSSSDISNVGIGSLTNIWPTYSANTTKDQDSFNAATKTQITQQIGSAVSTTIRGLSSACTAIIGGYDYHQSQLPSRIGQHNHDVFFGEIVGSILLTAKNLGKPIFLYISADGSVNSTLLPKSGMASTTVGNADVPWNQDNPERSMNYILAYDPNDRVEGTPFEHNDLGEASFQLNTFFEKTSSGATAELVVAPHPIADTAAQELAAASVFLNYLEFAGKRDLLNSPGGPLAKVKDQLSKSTNFDIFQYYGRMRIK